MENYHPVYYYDMTTDPDTPQLHETMYVPYREWFIDYKHYDIYVLHKNQTWYIIY